MARVKKVFAPHSGILRAVIIVAAAAAADVFSSPRTEEGIDRRMNETLNIKSFYTFERTINVCPLHT